PAGRQRRAATGGRRGLGRAGGGCKRAPPQPPPGGAGRARPADLDHLRAVAVARGRPVFFLSFDTNARPYVEKASREGAQLYNLLRAIPFNPRFTLKKTTFFHNLDVWDVVMSLRLPDRLAALAGPQRR